MSFDDELLDMFPHEIIVETSGGTDVLGAPILPFGTPTTRKGRVSGQHKTVRDKQGIEVLSTVNVAFAGTWGLTVDDRYTLPSGFSPQQPKPLSVKQASDGDGAHHERVFFV